MRRERRLLGAMKKRDKDIISQFNRLYITYRENFLEQFKQGYITCKYPLTDKAIEQHLGLERTIGIKLGKQGMTKFLTFDVDVKEDMIKATFITVDVIQSLNEYYGIPLEHIHVNFSGKKGFHVTLFFDSVIQDEALKPFYYELLDYLGQSEKDIEFRCSSSYGMKLPLGVHQETNQFTCFCYYNPQHEWIYPLNKGQSYDYFLDIKAMDLEIFNEFVLEDVDLARFTTKEAEGYEYAMSEINVNGRDLEDIYEEIAEVLNHNRLIYPRSRNRVTFLLSMYFKELGYAEAEIVDAIKAILLNTYDNYRGLIDKATDKRFMLSEVDRVVHNTFFKNYQLNPRRKDIEIYQDEILQILDIKEIHLKRLIFSILIHSKRYAKDDFYMAYSTMAKMGNTKNKSRLKQYLEELEVRGYIKIISQGVVDLLQSKLRGKKYFKPNRYRNLIESNGINSVIVKEDVKLEEACALLVDEKKAKKKLTRRQWELFCEYYA